MKSISSNPATARIPASDFANVGEIFTTCPLAWSFSQTGSEVEILVDNEYAILGRLCGDSLFLEGGFWLPVEDPEEGCTYDEDSAAEVVIDEPNELALETAPNAVR